MSLHFLLTAKAKSLSLATVARMSDEEARGTFAAIRWSSNDGKPFCPRCGCAEVYSYASRPIWKCKACAHQFSVTSGTIFADRKRPVRDYLLAIAIFTNGAKGHSALQLSRDLSCTYGTAYVISQKIREAIAAEQRGVTLTGTSEVDGAYFGGHARQENRKEDRADRRLAEEQTGRRKVVVVLRERNGRTLPFVCGKESDALPIIRQRIAAGITIHADEARSWDALHAHYDMQRVNHSVEFRSETGACSNQAESYFSRLRRAEIGTHHRIAQHLAQYAAEMAWREDNRRISNGEQFRKLAGLALAHPVSTVWAGYGRRKAA